MTPQEFNQIIEQRIAGYAARVANEERAETRKAKQKVIPIGPERRRTINRRHRRSERGQLGLDIQAIRHVIQTTEARLKQTQDRLDYLRGLLVNREQRRNDIPCKYRPNPFGVKGVTVVSNGRFSARLHLPGQYHYCGRHDTVEEAAAAIERKREELQNKGT